MTWWLSVGRPTFARSSIHWACSSFSVISPMEFHTEYMAAWAPHSVMKMRL